MHGELVALRFRAGADPDALTGGLLDRLARIAAAYEGQVDAGLPVEQMRGAAFVAATAYQVLGRHGVLWASGPLGLDAIHPHVASPLLFLIAGQDADAREAANETAALREEDLQLQALLETIIDLARERYELILDRAQRLTRLGPDASLEASNVGRALYGLCWSGIVHLVAGLMARDVPPLWYRRFDTARDAFDHVAAVSVTEIDAVTDGARMVMAYAGPRHLARLLRHVADGLGGAGIIGLPTPGGADDASWSEWLRRRAKTKPTLWSSHRRAIDAGILDRGTSGVLVLPTGAGKTTLSELKIAATHAAGGKVIFLVPTLALVDQLRDDLDAAFSGGAAGATVSEVGDLAALVDSASFASIEVMTPERLLAVTTFTEADLSDVGLIVFDECHLLTREGGGVRSVDAMLALLHAFHRAPDADFLLLSAMVENHEELSGWIREVTGRPCVSFSDPWKPSRQARGVMVYPRAQVAEAHRLVRGHEAARRNGVRPLPPKPRLLVRPHALFALDHHWASGAPTDQRIAALSDDPAELAHGERRRLRRTPMRWPPIWPHAPHGRASRRSSSSSRPTMRPRRPGGSRPTSREHPRLQIVSRATATRSRTSWETWHTPSWT